MKSVVVRATRKADANLAKSHDIQRGTPSGAQAELFGKTCWIVLSIFRIVSLPESDLLVCLVLLHGLIALVLELHLVCKCILMLSIDWVISSNHQTQFAKTHDLFMLHFCYTLLCYIKGLVFSGGAKPRKTIRAYGFPVEPLRSPAKLIIGRRNLQKRMQSQWCHREKLGNHDKSDGRRATY
jgi:hypothetical protein